MSALINTAKFVAETAVFFAGQRIVRNLSANPSNPSFLGSCAVAGATGFAIGCCSEVNLVRSASAAFVGIIAEDISSRVSRVHVKVEF